MAMKYVVPVVSGKGGVGKSTVAVNLALSLAKTGAKVALIDADFYGPSIPTLMGGGQIVPDQNERLVPAYKFGVYYVSIGFFLANQDDPIIWRGPMFNKALTQLFQDVNWGDVDYCIVDMPPGTGDAMLSLAQMLPLAGAVVVTTPQEVALSDVRKMINMLGKVNVEVLGLVENMAGFVTPDGTKVDIFGKGGGATLAKNFNLPLLASIPLVMQIREGGDAGLPAAVSDDASAKIFDNLAADLIDKLDRKGPQEGVQISL
jgi:ATP-binding protein involved in chromosome partitioning